MPQIDAKDVMTRDVKTIPAHISLRESAEFLIAHHISGAPVVDEAGNAVGILSESDLIDQEKRRAAIPRMALFGVYLVPEESLRRSYQEGMALQARDVMTRKVCSATEETPLEDLGKMMVEREIGRIPILRDGKPVGIVTREDILRGLLQRARADTRSAVETSRAA